MTNNSGGILHICNKENKYYQYCLKNNLPLIVLPRGHCMFCGADVNG